MASRTDERRDGAGDPIVNGQESTEVRFPPAGYYLLQSLPFWSIAQMPFDDHATFVFA